MTMPAHIQEFDSVHAKALRGIWFLGDVHAEFRYIPRALLAAKELPSHLIFLGDVDIDHKPFAEIPEPLRKHFTSVKVAFIHGNHDADSYTHWECLHNCGDAIALHGKVTEINGIRVAGLGGTRYYEEGRGASINVMSEIQGELPDTLAQIREFFSKEVDLVVQDVRNRKDQKTHFGWDNLSIIASEGNHVLVAV